MSGVTLTTEALAAIIEAAVTEGVATALAASKGDPPRSALILEVVPERFFDEVAPEADFLTERTTQR